MCAPSANYAWLKYAKPFVIQLLSRLGMIGNLPNRCVKLYLSNWLHSLKRENPLRNIKIIIQISWKIEKRSLKNGKEQIFMCIIQLRIIKNLLSNNCSILSFLGRKFLMLSNKRENTFSTHKNIKWAVTRWSPSAQR